jgi:hypothetical protein
MANHQDWSIRTNPASKNAVTIFKDYEQEIHTQSQETKARINSKLLKEDAELVNYLLLFHAANKKTLSHALNEVVYGFPTIARLATRTEILLSRPLETLLWRMQLENGLNPRQLPIIDFAFCDGSRKVAYGFAADLLGEIIRELLVAQQASTFREQVS